MVAQFLRSQSVQHNVRLLILLSPLLVFLPYRAALSLTNVRRNPLPPSPATESFRTSFQVAADKKTDSTAASHLNYQAKGAATPPLSDNMPSRRRFCDGASTDSPCIFDIGLNSGQDTAGYLANKQARVVAVDANPVLISAAENRFSDPIRFGRLRLVTAGLTARAPDGSSRTGLKFWVNTANDKFSSFVEEHGCRNGSGAVVGADNHTHCRRIDIPTRTCLDLVREFGSPSYMKIDIEGMDRACFRSLGALPQAMLPRYISIENVFPWDIDELMTLGYSRFKVVSQALLDYAAVGKDMKGNSGPWGDEAEDVFIGKEWHTEIQLKDRLPLSKVITLPNENTIKAWYDLHAAM